MHLPVEYDFHRRKVHLNMLSGAPLLAWSTDEDVAVGTDACRAQLTAAYSASDAEQEANLAQQFRPRCALRQDSIRASAHEFITVRGGNGNCEDEHAHLGECGLDGRRYIETVHHRHAQLGDNEVRLK